MADAKKKTDPAADARAERHAELDAQMDREDAMAAVPQKVIDPNEHAALLSLTGQKPERDMSDAPPPGLLGPHQESVNPSGAADADTSSAGVEK